MEQRTFLFVHMSPVWKRYCASCGEAMFWCGVFCVHGTQKCHQQSSNSQEWPWWRSLDCFIFPSLSILLSAQMTLLASISLFWDVERLVYFNNILHCYHCNLKTLVYGIFVLSIHKNNCKAELQVPWEVLCLSLDVPKSLKAAIFYLLNWLKHL